MHYMEEPVIAVLFTVAVLAPIFASGFIAGWIRCGSSPLTRHFWNS